jgi:hypothetical protein
VVRATLSEEFEQLIKEPRRGYHRWSRVEGVPVKGEGSGAPSRIRTRFKNIYLVAERP